MNATHGCESCGMPIESGPYCPHCTDADGALVEVDTTARWYGQVVGMRRDLMDGSIDLELAI